VASSALNMPIPSTAARQRPIRSDTLNTRRISLCLSGKRMRCSHLLLVSALMLASSVVGLACNKAGGSWWMLGQNMTRELSIDPPDSMLVARSSSQGVERLRDIRDRSMIDDTLALFRRYPDGYVDFSGAGGDYDFYFFRNGQKMLLRLGIRDSSRWSPGEATLNVASHRRQVPAAEVAALASRLGLTWPAPRE
jgi:hypothetical protein